MDVYESVVRPRAFFFRVQITKQVVPRSSGRASWNWNWSTDDSASSTESKQPVLESSTRMTRRIT